MSYYVKRTALRTYHTGVRQVTRGDVGWTGSIRSLRQARREQKAWEETGNWRAEVLDNTPAVRAQVRAWLRTKHLAAGVA